MASDKDIRIVIDMFQKLPFEEYQLGSITGATLRDAMLTSDLSEQTKHEVFEWLYACRKINGLQWRDYQKHIKRSSKRK